MLKEVPKILCITRANLCEKFKIGGSLARALIKDLYKKNLIQPVGDQHASFDLYKGSLAKSALEKAAEEAAQAEGKKKKWFILFSNMHIQEFVPAQNLFILFNLLLFLVYLLKFIFN